MSVNAIAYSHLIRALMDGAFNRAELAKITGLHSQTIGVHIRALHRRGVVYIADWTLNEINRNWIPKFTFNRHGASDVPRPFPTAPGKSHADWWRPLQGDAGRAVGRSGQLAG